MEKVLDLETQHEDAFEEDREDEKEKDREWEKDTEEEKEDFNIEIASDTDKERNVIVID